MISEEECHHTTEREAYDAFFAKTQELVSGDVRLRLQAGAATVVGRRSPHALYAETLVSLHGLSDDLGRETITAKG